MRANKKQIATITLITSLCAFIYGWLNFATDYTVLQQLHKLPQNTKTYINPSKQYTVTMKDQTRITNNFLNYYFAPWDKKINQNQLAQIKNDITKEIKKFKVNPGVGANTIVYSKVWVENIEKNNNLGHFPNYNQDAITIHDTNIRILPTTDPSFSDLKSVSKGYPFDNLQQTFVPEGTPIHIIHVSKDKDWYYVITSSYSGWIKDDDIAYASDFFKKRWQTGHYAVSTQDNIPLFDDKKRLTTKTRIGVLYPVTKTTKTNFTILKPTQTPAGEATTKSIIVNKAFLSQFPIPISSQNIAETANNLIGKPYGWGGIYGYRDCSSTMKDLFATFGIWLPRNSADQEKGGKFHSLSGLSDKKKEKYIIQHAIPFITLIHTSGHVMLYIGQRNGHPIVLQNMWGLHIYKLFNNKDRVVIGQTVITPLNFGKKFINTSQYNLLITKGMSNVISP